MAAKMLNNDDNTFSETLQIHGDIVLVSDLHGTLFCVYSKPEYMAMKIGFSFR